MSGRGKYHTFACRRSMELTRESMIDRNRLGADAPSDIGVNNGPTTSPPTDDCCLLSSHGARFAT